MTGTDVLYVRAGDTEPLELTISADLIDGDPLEDLDGLDVATLFVRKRGESTNEVDGASLSVVDSGTMRVRFDPVANGPDGENAFKEPGSYNGYIVALWLTGRETRHPGRTDLNIIVRPRYDS